MYEMNKSNEDSDTNKKSQKVECKKYAISFSKTPSKNPIRDYSSVEKENNVSLRMPLGDVLSLSKYMRTNTKSRCIYFDKLNTSPNGMLFVDVAHFFYQAIIPNGITKERMFFIQSAHFLHPCLTGWIQLVNEFAGLRLPRLVRNSTIFHTFSIKNYTIFQKNNSLRNPRKSFFENFYAVYQSNKNLLKLNTDFMLSLAQNLIICKKLNTTHKNEIINSLKHNKYDKSKSKSL